MTLRSRRQITVCDYKNSQNISYLKDLTAKDSKIYTLDELFPTTGEESFLLVSCRRDQYSASAIARAVEDCNAQLINLNVLGVDMPDAELVVQLRIDRRHTTEVARSLLRYGYEILDWTDSEPEIDHEVLSDRISHLFRYLDM